jgi:putative intracellular protease/amidase
MRSLLFKDSGAEITLASPKGGQPPLDPKSTEKNFQTAATERFRADKEAQTALANTLKLEGVSPAQYDALFYPGGHGPLWDLAEDKNSIALIEAMYARARLFPLFVARPGYSASPAA